MNGEVRLDSISAITRANERRLGSLALFPQVTSNIVAYLAVVNVFNEEIDVLVIDSASNVLDAQTFSSAFNQNLNYVPVVDFIHSANIYISAQSYKEISNL